MVKKEKDNNNTNNTENVLDSEMKTMLKALIENQNKLQERLDYIEGNNANINSKALLQMVNFLYDTDDKHISELSRIPVTSARPLAYGMALEAILDPKMKDIPLSQVLRNNYLRLMRSVGGIHLGRGLRLAEDQAAAAAEEAEEMDLGD